MDHSQQIGAALLAARASGAAAGLSPAEIARIDHPTALRAQDIVVEAIKRPIAAWKVAVVPDGVVLAAPIHDLFPAGARLPLSLCGDCGIECEIAFRIARDIGPRREPYSAEDVSGHIAHACVTAEILNSRLPGKYQSPRNAQLADSLSNAALIAGEPVANWHARDFRTIPVEFSVDGNSVVSRQGGHPTGDPFGGVVALANHLSSRGMTLAAGQIVTAGSYTGVHFAPTGGRFSVRFDGFPELKFEIG
jgi:2-keto-4-pentenoate hydratase